MGMRRGTGMGTDRSRGTGMGTGRYMGRVRAWTGVGAWGGGVTVRAWVGARWCSGTSLGGAQNGVVIFI